MMQIQKIMAQDELRQRIHTYFLAVEPLARILVMIQSLQPAIGYRVKEDGSFERIEQYGWSEEARSLYDKVQKEIEYLKDLYFGKLTDQKERDFL